MRFSSLRGVVARCCVSPSLKEGGSHNLACECVACMPATHPGYSLLRFEVLPPNPLQRGSVVDLRTRRPPQHLMVAVARVASATISCYGSMIRLEQQDLAPTTGFGAGGIALFARWRRAIFALRLMVAVAHVASATISCYGSMIMLEQQDHAPTTGLCYSSRIMQQQQEHATPAGSCNSSRIVVQQQDHAAPAGSCSRSSPGATRSNREQPGAATSSQEQPGAARSTQEQPGAARSS